MNHRRNKIPQHQKRKSDKQSERSAKVGNESQHIVGERLLYICDLIVSEYQLEA